MKQCGAANVVKIDEILVINHRVGKIRLHVASNSYSKIRVHLRQDLSLHVETREYGTAWHICPEGLLGPIQDAIRGYLTLKSNHEYFYLHGNEIDPILVRQR